MLKIPSATSSDMPAHVPFQPTEADIETMAGIARLEAEWLASDCEDCEESHNDRFAWMNAE